ncbi:hypothetical protein AX15_005023 [Amanita polypyramis BW_CC]|nr:hypothetical protein AX15_005023 [Amanita polypyramis BW_CC]
MNPVVGIFHYMLHPVLPLSSFGLQVTTLDLLAVLRLCLAMRQLREDQHRRHLAKLGPKSIEDVSFVRSLTTTLLVVYGGEAITAPFLGYPPSFMTSVTFPVLYTLVQAIVDFMPAVPTPSATNELPLALLDGLTRAYLLCNLIPPPVTSNTSQLLAHSPWTLLLTSFITANGGFFLANLFSFLDPTPLTVQTPPELLPYGWTTTDLWCAPLITGLYSLLTHAQPFWIDFHNLLCDIFGARVEGKPTLPVDPEVARANCAVILAFLFTARAVKKFGLLGSVSAPSEFNCLIVLNSSQLHLLFAEVKSKTQ